MSKNKNHKTISSLLLALGLLASATTSAWHRHGGEYDGSRHYHGYSNNYNRGWPYGGGGGFYFGGGGWDGPNVIINVPAPRYYVPECQNIEVCNSYGDCWIEPYCD